MYNKENNAEMGKNLDFIESLEARLLNPESDLRRLSSTDQFELIASKAAIHPEAIIPKPSGGRNEIFHLFEHSRSTGKPLSIKFGIDPTGPNIHFGHAISLLMLRRFQWMGHHIDLVVGDFTGSIGDPSGRTSERNVLSDSDIKRNMSTYIEQASRILNLSRGTDVTVRFNSEWLSKINMKDWLRLLQKINGPQLIQREDFVKRLKAGGTVSAAEMLYPLYMAYDSVELGPDIELGGVDQLLNLHWCRELMRLYREKSEAFILVDLLPGTSGEKDEKGQLAKMSKSKNNFIMVTEKPEEIYGKVMSIPDEVMWIWYRELTEISTKDLNQLKRLVANEKLHPMEAKRLLARAVIATFNHFDKNIVKTAEEAFNQKFGKQKVLIPSDIEQIQGVSGERFLDLLSKVSGESRANIRKMIISEGSSGVKILEDDNYRDILTEELTSRKINKGEILIIKLGKRRYFKISSK